MSKFMDQDDDLVVDETDLYHSKYQEKEEILMDPVIL